MTVSVTYYAMINDFSTRDKPTGLVRRIEDAEGRSDEAFSRSLQWEHTSLLYSAERGDTQNEFVPISEEEAERIVKRIRKGG